LRRVVIDNGVVTIDEAELTGRFGRIRAAVEAPTGGLYLLTSNRHLGTPREGDDRLIRLSLD
jgi:hypothetical protein